MKIRLGTPEFVIAATLIALATMGIAIGFGRDSNEGSPDATTQVVGQVATIAHRDELIRGLRFRHLPRPLVVSPAQTRADALRDIDHEYPAAKRRTDARLLELLGLLPLGTDLRAIESNVSGQEVAGYYDTRRKRLAVVSGPAGGDPVLSEITLSHELNHALEDQRFGLHENAAAGTDDSATAYTALVEGTATAVMTDYTQRYIPPGSALASALGSLGPAAASTKSIPPYIQRTLEFSYNSGESFVNALRNAAGGSWKLVNYALTKRPPATSEQVMHPLKYLRGERALPVRVGPLRLGAGWTRAAGGTIGEIDTRELLHLGTGDAEAATAAAGWGGGRFELWSRTPAPPGCADPCRASAALVARWRWDTPADAREFDATLPLYVAKGLHGRGAGPGRWRVGEGGAAIAVDAAGTTLAFAPSPAQAAQVAASAGRR